MKSPDMGDVGPRSADLLDQPDKSSLAVWARFIAFNTLVGAGLHRQVQIGLGAEVAVALLEPERLQRAVADGLDAVVSPRGKQRIPDRARLCRATVSSQPSSPA